MGAGHSHTSAAQRNRGSLIVAFGLGLSILVVQLIGALVSGSLALLADAVHVFADVFGIGLALIAVSVAKRPTKSRRTFGLYRLEILATVFNGLLLLGLSIYILIEAYDRWFHPSPINAPVMIAAAGYGLVANAVAVTKLRSGSKESLTLRGAYLEMLADAIGSAGVIVAGIVVLTTGWTRADSLVSVGIALFIVPRTLMLLRDSLGVLMENAPPGLDLDDVRRHMLGVHGVVAVHDLHAWTITSGMASLSAHVEVEPDPYDEGAGAEVLQRLGVCLLDCFGISHTTFQLESVEHAEGEEGRHP